MIHTPTPTTHEMTAAVDRLAYALADAAGLASGRDRDGQPEPTPDDLRAALRLPVSAGAVIHDLCRSLGIEPPASVTRSLEDA